MTNLRPGSLRRLRLEYDDIAAVRPDIIFCQAAGYPADGPRADDPAYDDVIQAATGVADVMDRTLGEAALVPMLLADKVCGLTIVSSICAALVHRALTGEGQRIEVPMIDVMKAFMMTEHGSGGIAYPRTEPAGYPRILTKQRRPKRTADGWIHMLPYSEDNWSKLLATVGREEMMSDPRFTSLRSRHLHSEFLYGELEKILPSKTTDAWMEFCSEHGIPATRLSTLEDLVDELPLATHPVAGEYRSVPPPVRFSATPADVRRHAPLIGQHNDELLTELGYTDEERRELAATGVIGTGPED